MSVPPAIVVFDLGEVLATPTTLLDDLSSRAAVAPEMLAPAYWRRRLEYDLGLDAIEYWTDVLESISVPVTASALQDLIRIDTQAWTTVRADADALLERLYRSKIRLGVLSNATLEMATAARTSTWSKWISDWFFSVEIGLAKPDPRIFTHVQHELSTPPGSIVYIDDSPKSVESARAVGWNAYLWTSAADAAVFLAKAVR